MDNRRSWKGQLSLKESEHRRYSDSEEQKSKKSVSNNSGKITKICSFMNVKVGFEPDVKFK